MKFGSLFAGIGGIDLGLERAGMTCAWQVELDDYCNRVLSKHWPDVPRFRDVRDVGAANLAPVDLIAGGFPCQDISEAGKRAGIDGERSGLWREFARIIGELRPRYVLVENVSALRVRGFGRVLGDLAACGYDAEWDCIPAAAVGAPHIRDRVFIVAYATGSGFGAQRGGDGSRSETRSAPRRLADDGANGRARDVADAAGTRRAKRVFPSYREAWHDARGQKLERLGGSIDAGSEWDTEPPVGRLVDGVPPGLVRPALRAYGNAVVPAVAEHVGRLIMQAQEAAA